jgi:hypothetical protein
MGSDPFFSWSARRKSLTRIDLRISMELSGLESADIIEKVTKLALHAQSSRKFWVRSCGFENSSVTFIFVAEKARQKARHDKTKMELSRFGTGEGNNDVSKGQPR